MAIGVYLKINTKKEGGIMVVVRFADT